MDYNVICLETFDAIDIPETFKNYIRSLIPSHGK